MSNPQDNPSTPPPPSPSNSSSSTRPSETPKPRFRRKKMLSRKTVASGELSKVLNKKLKVSQSKESSAQESDSSFESESFKSASEGEEHGSSDTEKFKKPMLRDVKLAETSRSGGKKKGKKREGESGEERVNRKKGVPAICGVVEESGIKSGGSGSGEVAEGLVHLSKQRDEPVSSAEETLAGLLKKVGASYDLKKLKATSQKAPIASKPTKKSKTSSPKPTVPSVPKGRATRSKVKQSEAELQKALEESKKKKKEKGKTKVAESSKVVEEEEMELVHQERGTTVEVPTPKRS
uniref:Protein ENL-like n=1 Tax=Nicotiana sylvestris TaxID=4096 RepID=A0A1U7W300_NICSY|nr:PREDICTED: protein ENL-like [Nicotiana sylvestris]